MAIVVIEGNHYAGKSTFVNFLTKNYEYESSKSVPNWFREYIPFARSLESEEQKKVYEIGHIAAFNEAKSRNINVVFDRFVYSTYIRLAYANNMGIEQCVEQILAFPYKPDLLVVLIVPISTIKERFVKRKEVVSIDENFNKFENSIYLELEKKCDNILIVRDENQLERVALDTTESLKKRKELVNESIK